MTSKEKAKELVNKYYNILPNWVNIEDAKRCALISVDEVLLIKREIWDDFHSEYFDFWGAVKQEIKKL